MIYNRCISEKFDWSRAMKAMLGFMNNEQQASSGRHFSCANNGIVASADVGIVASAFSIVVSVVISVVISVVVRVRKLLFLNTGFRYACA